MSLYNMVCGINPNAALYLHMLGLEIESIGRFRDAYVHSGKIVVFTRTGGNNRADWEEPINYLRQNPYYVSDNDDSFDSTFAHFHYSFPPEHLAVLDEIKDDVLPMDKFRSSLASAT